jgi:hypothetical protein
LDPIVIARDGRGRATLLSGIVTADVTVACIDPRDIERWLEDDSLMGLVEGNKVASPVFYILRFTEVRPNPHKVVTWGRNQIQSPATLKRSKGRRTYEPSSASARSVRRTLVSLFYAGDRATRLAVALK